MVGGMINYSLINKIVYSVLLVSLILLATFRTSENFYDVNNYINMYSDAISGARVNAEYSFVFISKLSQVIGLSYFGMFFIYALISLSTKLYVINNFSFSPLLIFVLYCSSYLILYEFVQMRAGAGFGVFLLSIVFYKDDKKLLSAVCIAVAVSLHYSIVFLFVLSFFSVLFIRNKKSSVSMFGLLFLALTLVMIIYSVVSFVFPVVDFKPHFFSFFYGLAELVLPDRIYQGYFEYLNLEPYTPSMKQVLSLLLSFLTVLILFFKLISREWFYYYSCLMVIYGSWLYFFFAQFGVVVERMSELLILFFIFVVDGVIKKNARIGYAFFGFVFLVFFVNLSTRVTYIQL